MRDCIDLFHILFARLQRNYKYFCSCAEKIEYDLRLMEIEAGGLLSHDENNSAFGPMLGVSKSLPGNFDLTNLFDKIFGAIPFYALHILFFILVSTIAVLAHFLASVSF